LRRSDGENLDEHSGGFGIYIFILLPSYARRSFAETCEEYIRIRTGEKNQIVVLPSTR